MRRELREQRAVGGRIAALACQHQRLQFGFMSSHASATRCSVVSPSGYGTADGSAFALNEFPDLLGRREKIAAARSPSIPAGLIAGAPLSGPSLLESVI